MFFVASKFGINEYDSQNAQQGLVRKYSSLEQIQMRTGKQVWGLSDTQCPTCLADLELYPMETRRIIGNLFLMFNRISTSQVDIFLGRSSLEFLKRYSEKMFSHHSRTEVWINVRTLQMVSVYNDSHKEFISAQNKEYFRSTLNKSVCLSHFRPPLPPPKI